MQVCNTDLIMNEITFVSHIQLNLMALLKGNKLKFCILSRDYCLSYYCVKLSLFLTSFFWDQCKLIKGVEELSYSNLNGDNA